MSSSAVLSTALVLVAVLAVVVTLACVRSCQRWAEDARHSAAQLIESRGRLVAAEHSLEVLDKQLRSLRGLFHQRAHREREREREHDEVYGGTAPRDERTVDFVDVDPELAATLALQRAPAATPGKTQ